MADAKKCDRCGKYYEEGDNQFRIDGYVLSRIKAINVGEFVIEEYDLCNDCCKDFFHFMMMDGE